MPKHPAAVWRNLNQDSSGITYDWTVVAYKELGDYSVVDKILMNDAGIFHVYYVNKHSANFPKNRMTFLNFVDNLFSYAALPIKIKKCSTKPIVILG